MEVHVVSKPFMPKLFSLGNDTEIVKPPGITFVTHVAKVPPGLSPATN